MRRTWGSKDRALQADDPLAYQLVEMRRQQFDTMIWQVPALTFTGQAFIFTILLNSSVAPWGRVIAGVLSVGISYLSLVLLARHRQAEEAASEWLSDYEERHGWPDPDRQHGPQWQARRNSILPGPVHVCEGKTRRTGWGRVPLWPGYTTWVVALYGLIVAAIVATVLGLTLA